MLEFFHSDYPAKVLKAKWDYYAPGQSMAPL